MRLSKLIEILEDAKKEHGDVEMIPLSMKVWIW